MRPVHPPRVSGLHYFLRSEYPHPSASGSEHTLAARIFRNVLSVHVNLKIILKMFGYHSPRSYDEIVGRKQRAVVLSNFRKSVFGKENHWPGLNVYVLKN